MNTRSTEQIVARLRVEMLILGILGLLAAIGFLWQVLKPDTADLTNRLKNDTQFKRSLADAMSQEIPQSSDIVSTLAGNNDFIAAVAALGESEIPSGAIIGFSLSECPDGWKTIPKLQGRYLVGSYLGEEPKVSIGEALKNKEDRPTGKHTHVVSNSGLHRHTAVANGNHSHTYRTSASKPPYLDNTANVSAVARYSIIGEIQTQDAGSHSHEINTDGTHAHKLLEMSEAEGTNSPYLTALFCEKR